MANATYALIMAGTLFMAGFLFEFYFGRYL